MDEEEVDNLINGDGWISDESSFYGEDDEREDLEEVAATLDIWPYWQAHAESLNTIAFKRISSPTSLDGLSAAGPVLHNPYEGCESAWQLNESIDDFLKRLPPLTSDHVGPWIWVGNPYPERRWKGKGKGKEDVAGLEKEGSRYLEEFLSIKKGLEKAVAASPKYRTDTARKSAVTKQLAPFRKDLEASIRKLAVEKKVTSGKWMLFPSHEKLHRTWRTVAEAVTTNRLGTSAKVAAGGDDLICIYTYDFTDTADVRRVLDGLVDIGLVPGDGGSYGNGLIYYKCDAYTYLGLFSANEYGLKPTLYASNTMLASAAPARNGQHSGLRPSGAVEAKEPPKKKQKLGVSTSNASLQKQNDLTGWVF